MSPAQPSPPEGSDAAFEPAIAQGAQGLDALALTIGLSFLLLLLLLALLLTSC